jgi:hypothetical protein
MANLLETIRNAALTSIYGRRLGITPADNIAGFKAVQTAVQDLTTAATTVNGYGTSRVIATGSSQGPVQYTLPAPIPGTDTVLCLNTTSTGSYQFLSTANGASILAASDGTTKSLVNLIGQGGAVTLRAMTTAIWQVIASVSTGGVTYTTST